MFRVTPVETKQEWKDFIELPWKIYEGDPNWVPPLQVMIRENLNTRKNPFFKHAEMQPLLAYRGKEPVGRIVPFIDQHHNVFQGEDAAFFGYFETENDESTFDALMEQASAWAHQRGMKKLRGPFNLNTSQEIGLLIDGYDDPPTFLMPYNPKYYPELFEKKGFQKAKDLYAWASHKDRPFSDNLLRLAEKAENRSNVTYRSADMKNFNRELELILDIYNDAWKDNWGHVPLTMAELKHVANDLKKLIDPELLMFLEVDGEPAGFGAALPDLNQVLKKIPDGKLFPFGLPKLLWNLKGPGKPKTLDRCRIYMLGIKKAYQRMGLGPLLYVQYLKRCVQAGYPRGEASWILEDNESMNRALERMNFQISKTYRLYDYAFTE